MSETAAEQAVRLAIEVAKAAEQAWLNCGCDGERCEHQGAMEDADAEVERLRAVLRLAPRTWGLCEEGNWYETVRADSVEAAMRMAREGVEASNYDVRTTVWINVRVRCELTDETGSDTVALDPDPPRCVDADDHDWQSPHELVGGLRENPGVHGHGGGVVIAEVCVRCGCERVTDTWAHNPETGEQGLPSVCYKPRKYETEVRAMRWQTDRAEHESAPEHGADGAMSGNVSEFRTRIAKAMGDD